MEEVDPKVITYNPMLSEQMQPHPVFGALLLASHIKILCTIFHISTHKHEILT
jgi:hypothetical protein